MTEKPIDSLMVIDDNDVDQLLYKRIIERSGLVNTIVQCLYAEDALEILRDGQQPDAILLDINMQRMNGFEFLDAATAEFGEDFSVVVVMLTTSLNPRDETRAAQYSVVKDYFNKPLTLEQLVKISEMIKQ